MSKSIYELRQELLDIPEDKLEYGLYGEEPVWMLVNRRWTSPTNRKHIKSRELMFTEEAARELGIEFKDWWKVEKGEWGVSDDGIVMPCIAKYGMGHGTHRHTYTIQFRYPVSRRLCMFYRGKKNGKKKFLARTFIYTGNFGRHNAVQYDQVWANQKHVQEALYMWAKLYYSQEGQLLEVQCRRIIDIARPRKFRYIGNYQAYVNWFIGQNVHIRNCAALMLKKVFTENGLGAGETAEMLKETFDMARDQKDVKEMHNVAKTVLEVHQKEDGLAVRDPNKLGAGEDEETRVKALMAKQTKYAIGDKVLHTEEMFAELEGNEEKMLEFSQLADESYVDVKI